jgi:hypothetical protein
MNLQRYKLYAIAPEPDWSREMDSGCIESQEAGATTAPTALISMETVYFAMGRL